MDIKDAIDKAVECSSWSKAGIARQLGLLPQGLNDKLTRRKYPKIELVLEVLDTIGYDLAIVPKSSKLPNGSIIVTHSQDDSAPKKVGRPKRSDSKKED